MILWRIASKENSETIRQFLEKESLRMPILIDPTGQVERFYGVWVHPTSYVINKQALVRYRAMGAFDWTNLQTTSVIDQLLKER